MLENSWVQLGTDANGPVYYCKKEIYDMEWNKNRMNIQDYIVAFASFGGPIAMSRDMANPDASQDDTDIYVYTCSGILISKFASHLDGQILRMGWTNEENIVVVTSDCVIYLFDMFGTQILKSEFPPQVKDQDLLEIKVWETGVVLLTKNLEFWIANDFVNHTLMPKSDLIELPNWIEVLPPKQIQNVEILVAPRQNSLYSYTNEEIWDYELVNGPFTRISSSPNGSLLAFYTNDGFLWIVSSDFTKNVSEFNCKNKTPPDQLTWCGNDAVVLTWRPDQINRDFSLLLIVSILGHHAKYTFYSPIVCFPEMDGLRILTNSTCEYLYKVAESNSKIFGIGSLDPAAMLFDSYTDFENKKASTVVSTRSMKDKMPTAIQTCLDAAIYEMDPNLQKRLLQAAAYGKSFVKDFDHAKFEMVCKSIRIINAVRDKHVGIPLTFEQYQIVTPQVLVDRLAYRNLHVLSFKICEYLRLNLSKLILHAASLKLSSNQDDKMILDQIQKKFGVAHISYGQLSSIAYQKGKKSLAIKLLSLEEAYSQQIPLLVQLEENTKAIAKAIESGEADLVSFVVYTCWKKKMLKDLKDPLIIPNVIAWLEEVDPEMLKNYKMHQIPLKESIQANSEVFKCVQEAYALTKPKTFEFGVLKDEIDLLMIQKEIDSKIPLQDGKPVKELEGSSLATTIDKLITSNNEDLALKLKKDFKVTDKKYFMIKLKVLAKTEKWEDFEKLAIKSVDYSIELCIQHDNNKLSQKLIEKVPDLTLRAEYYLSMGLVDDAFLVSKNNPRLLTMIKNHPNSSKELKEAIGKILK